MILFTHELSTIEKIELRAYIFLITLAIVDIFPLEILYVGDRTNPEVWKPFTLLLSLGVIVFLSFLFINFQLIPNIINRVNRLLNITIFLVILLLLYFVFPLLGVDFFYYLIFIVLYSIFKYFGFYIFNNREKIHVQFRYFTPGRIITFSLGVIFILFLGGNVEREITVFVGIVIFCGLLLYGFSFHKWIPQSFRSGNPIEAYFNKIFLILIISTIPIGILVLIITNNPNIPVTIVGLNFLAQLLITSPLSWWLFKKVHKEEAALQNLKINLDQSNANIDFLRSQINPHFLFNTLNTLYAAALQEGSERTSEGIQKLGDMMRFMLHENFKEHISLTQEIQYLENYIDLQKIKTDPNPQVKLELVINVPESSLAISPMLLIPFVENSFKHGVSFKEPSPISIHLDCQNKILRLRVCNVKHVKNNIEIPMDVSGIGLSNVKQRLLLLYPKKHELIIKETKYDYKINLIIELN